MAEVVVIAHNIRSTFNVGSIFRTCEGFGVSKIILSGYTPYPLITSDKRLPHISQKLTEQIHKTALGAEKMVNFEYQETLDLASLKADGFRIVGLEQDRMSVPIQTYVPFKKTVLVLGEEVYGIPSDVLRQCDDLIEIPMKGMKESFNVSVACGIALFSITISA